MISGGLDCEGCQSAYDEAGEDPPCDECGKPDNHPANILAWKVWLICNDFERPPAMNGLSPITAVSATSLIKDMGGDERDLHKVLRIERAIYPIICETAKAGKDARN